MKAFCSSLIHLAKRVNDSLNFPHGRHSNKHLIFFICDDWFEKVRCQREGAEDVIIPSRN